MNRDEVDREMTASLMEAASHRIRPAEGRIPELDGLRGTAIFLVIVFHYWEQQGAVSGGGLTPILQRLFLMGWSGVDLFFVLSGFLIGGILLDARASSSYFQTFYTRRFFRIIPIYYLWIVAYIVLIGVAGAALRARSNSGLLLAPDLSIYSHFLFLQNLMVVPFAGLAGAWFSHLWSLAVEEQFYLVSPVVVRLFSMRLLAIFLGCVIVAAPLLRIVLRVERTDPWLVSVLMPCRADSLAMGMLAAVFWRRDRFREWLSDHCGTLYALLAVLFAGVVALWKWSPQSQTRGMESIGFTWLAAFYIAILLLALARREGPIARLARMAWLRELGRVSYCIYIIHLAVNVIFHSLLRRASPATSDWRGVAVTLLAALATYGIAWCSWKFFEGPLVRLGHLSKYQPAGSMVMDLGPQ
jgi:peptidoglycan/LPS O-acetylase OafA/YrhL